MERGHAVCVGESMAVLVPEQSAPLEDVSSFRHRCGGAESNVARGLVAHGVPAAWLSRVGDDGFGRNIVRTLASAGVHTGAVQVDPERPTGLYVKETGPDGSRMHYYRSSSAASALSPALLDAPAVRRLLDGAALVHLSGITAALSDTALALVRRLVAAGGPGRPPVAFDLNWRPALWRGRNAAPVLRPLLDAADVALCGADEAETVFGTGDPRKLRALLPGPRTLVVRDGPRAAVALDRAGRAVAEPALRVAVVEPVGAGDAFTAGFLAGTLRGLAPARCLRLGHLSAAATLVVRDDHGAPPPAPVVEALLAAAPERWAATAVDAGGFGPAGAGGAPS